jgi:hypothetical protein
MRLPPAAKATYTMMVRLNIRTLGSGEEQTLLLSLMNRALVDASPSASGTLNYHWIVEYGWGFVMRPHFPNEVFDRAKVDDDFTALSKVLRDAIAQYIK